MKTRKLLRTDLPIRRTSLESLHIPVMVRGRKQYVCDTHTANEELCYLEDAKGIPTKISSMDLILDERSKEDIRNEIERLTAKRMELNEQDEKLQNRISKLRFELRKA